VTHKKKLIEVALPLEAINAACKLDKDRKTGTIRNIHKWFAAMPLPALRAMIFAALVDAPTDEQELQHLLGIITRLVGSGHQSPSADVLAEARRAIRASVGDDAPTVFDPFCGGGSTLVEAQRLGLPAKGSDLNPIPVLITKALTEIPPTIRSHRRLHSDPNALDTGTETAISGFLDDVQHYAG
jgi:putative DNA methylase